MNGSGLAMGAMLAMCVSVFLLAALIPTLGTAPGILLAVLAAGAMVLIHWKLMGPGHGH